ncbi:Gfo/Idh/MocA family oxidoreductase [Erythrobacter alti]|uniref:Gfo/Idh/MocA family protein n=1 Tax=Erythrobacter alti TaxID=1896145 RepID=UPI0030F4A720
MTLRVGIVSAAWGAFAHLPAWRALQGVEVTSICTSRQETAEAAAERCQIERPFWDALAMCRDPDIDIVDLGTRPGVRLPMVLEALKHGKHIYNSCPHAPDWAGAKAIDFAWDRNTSKTAVDAFSRYLPAHMQMRSMIEAGNLGKLLGGNCRFNMSLFNRPDKRFPYNWFADGAAGVSALRNFGSHLLYFLCEMLGPVEELVADQTILLKEWEFADGDRMAANNPDYANLILRFASGVRISLQTSWNQPAQEGWTIDMFGTDARLQAVAPSFPTVGDTRLLSGLAGDRADSALQPVELTTPATPHIAMDHISEPAPAYPMALTMQSLVDTVHGKGSPYPDFALALEVERLLEAARISNEERRWVRLAGVD